MTTNNANQSANLTRIAGILVVTIVTLVALVTLVVRKNTLREKAHGVVNGFDEFCSAEGKARLHAQIQEQRIMGQTHLRGWVGQVNRDHHNRNRQALVDFEVELADVVGSRVDQARAAVPHTVKQCTSDGFFQMMKDTTFSDDEFNDKVMGIVEFNVFPHMTLAQNGGLVALHRLQQRLEENQGVLLATLATGAQRDSQTMELRNILAENVQHVKTGDLISEQARRMKITIGLGALVPVIFWKAEALQFKALWLLARRLAVAGARKVASRGAIAVGASFLDGPLPVFDVLGALLTGYTVYEVVSEWKAMKKRIPAQIDRNLRETLDTYEVALNEYFHGLAVESYEVAQRRQGELESKTMARLNQE